MTPRRQVLLFAALQTLDLLTTLLFVRHGVVEANPLIRGAMAVAHQPALAVAVPKLLAMSLAAYAWHSGRTKLLGRVNLFYSGCVAWNLLAVLAAPI
jgi:hypothetical protein